MGYVGNLKDLHNKLLLFGHTSMSNCLTLHIFAHFGALDNFEVFEAK